MCKCRRARGERDASGLVNLESERWWFGMEFNYKYIFVNIVHLSVSN